MLSTAETAWKSELSYKKTCVSSRVGNYLRPSNNSGQLIFNINAVVLMFRFTKIVKCVP